MDPIPRERMGNATSLFNLMRNIGGSIGIAVTGTMLARNQQAHFATLGTNVDPYNPASQAMLERLRSGFMAAGADPVTASERALAAMSGLVHRQAAIVSLRGDLPAAGDHVPAADPAGAAHEAADGPQRSRRGALTCGNGSTESGLPSSGRDRPD